MSKIIKVDRDTVKSIAIASIPAMLAAPISIPVAVLYAIAFGRIMSRPGSDGNYEIELPTSFSEWILKDNPVYEQRVLEEAKKRASVIYWTDKHDKQNY